MVSRPKSSDISLSVVFSLPLKKRVVSQFPVIVSALSLYMAFSWLCACKIRQADISRLRIVAISFSSLGICPIFATSSSRQRTCMGSLPPYTSSALSHKRLKSCVYIMATMKLKVSSVSEIMTKRAVFLSPNVSSFKSSVSMSSLSSRMSNGAKRAPHEIKIDLAVLPVTFCKGLFNHIHKKFTFQGKKIEPGTCFLGSRLINFVYVFLSTFLLPACFCVITWKKKYNFSKLLSI